MNAIRFDFLILTTLLLALSLILLATPADSTANDIFMGFNNGGITLEN